MPNTIQVYIRTHAMDYGGGTDVLGEVWASFNHDWANNPNTSQPWTWDEINALEIGAGLEGDPETPMCSQIYVEITYTPAVTVPPILRAIEKY